MATIISEWTDARVEQLKTLYGQNYSASQIAAVLGFSTRNAVIGKLHRLGLKRGRLVTQPKAARAPRKGRQPKAITIRKPRVFKVVERLVAGQVMEVCEFEHNDLRQADVVSLSISLIDLEPGQCRYPTSDAPTLFCGTPQLVESSYCPQHAELCRGVLSPRKGKVLPFAQNPKPRKTFAGAWV